MSQEARSTQTRGFKKKERTRRLLIAAAVEEIAHTGEAFTILDVTKRADVSNGTFYNYFPDRNALVDAVVTEVLTSFTDTSAELVTVGDPVRRFATISALLLEHSAANPQLATVLLRLQSLIGSNALSREPFQHLHNDLTDAVEQGRLSQAPTDAALDLVAGTLSRAVLRVTSHAEGVGYRHEVLRLLLEAFGLDPAEATDVAAEAVAAVPELQEAYRLAQTRA